MSDPAASPSCDALGPHPEAECRASPTILSGRYGTPLLDTPLRPSPSSYAPRRDRLRVEQYLPKEDATPQRDAGASVIITRSLRRPPLPDPRFAGPPSYALGRPWSKNTAGLLLRSGNDCFHSRTALVAMYSLASVRLHAMQRTVLSRHVLMIDSSNFWFR